MLTVANPMHRQTGFFSRVIVWLAMSACVLLLSSCASIQNDSTLSGGTTFIAQDCAASPISGLPFQACEVSPWIIGSGHATTGGFSARAASGPGAPGLEGGGIDSEKVYLASMRDGTARITVTDAVPYSSAGSFYETTPLNAASLVDPACVDIREGACKAGSPIGELTDRELAIGGHNVRLETFSVLNNPAAAAGFVAFIRGQLHPSRPGFTTAMVVRGFYARRDAMSDQSIAGLIGPLKFRSLGVSAWN